MNPEAIIESSTQELKRQLKTMLTDLPEGDLTPEKAAEFTEGMQKAIASAARSGYESFLKSHEHQEEKMIVGGQVIRYKQDSEKKF